MATELEKEGLGGAFAHTAVLLLPPLGLLTLLIDMRDADLRIRLTSFRAPLSFGFPLLLAAGVPRPFPVIPFEILSLPPLAPPLV